MTPEIVVFEPLSGGYGDSHAPVFFLYQKIKGPI